MFKNLGCDPNKNATDPHVRTVPELKSWGSTFTILQPSFLAASKAIYFKRFVSKLKIATEIRKRCINENQFNCFRIVIQ